MKRTLLAALLALPALALTAPTAQAQCGANTGGFCFRLFSHMHQHGPLYNYGPYAGYYPFAPYGPWDSNLNYTGPTGGGSCGPLCGGRCGGRGCGNGGFGHGGFGHGGFGGGCGAGGCGGGGVGGGLFTGLHSLGGHGGFGGASCGGSGCSYSDATFRNVFFRSHPLSHRAKISTGCSACSSPVGVGTPVYPQAGCTGGCSASAAGAAGLDPVLLVASIESPAVSRYVRER
jgi:hypothetical protein